MFAGPVLSVVLLAGAVPPGLDNAELARRGEEAFAAGVRQKASADRARPHFQSAAEHFEELRRRGARNPELYRNLGNSYLLAGDLPRAILSYRRGLRLAPGDEALRTNLARARALVAYPEEGAFARPAADERPAWLSRAGWLFLLAFALYCAACAALLRWWAGRRAPALLLGLLLLGGAGALTTVLVLQDRAGRAAAARPLVVIARDEVTLRKGNGEAYPPRAEAALNRGVEARLVFRRGGWLQIELGSGEVGWVPASAALVDGPDEE